MNNQKLFQINFLKAQAEIMLLILRLNKNKNKNRRFAVRSMLKERKLQGYYNNLISEMRLNDTESFINFHRMDIKLFDELLSFLGPSLKNIPSRVGEEITVAERLSLTLRFLASGDSMKSIGFFEFRIGASTVSSIIRETCELIWEKLSFVFPTPSTNLWENVANEFFNRWDFPNCLGAIDGKHVVIQALPNHNSLTYNYKNTHSLILLAACDADYKFLLVDIGALGHNSDATIFRNCNFGEAIIKNSETLKLPSDRKLPSSNIIAPYVFVADEAFPILSNLMRPFPGRNTGNLPRNQEVFNYRLSRARRVIENAFGILANRWRIYRKPIIASKVTVKNIIKATTCLHNWLRIKKATGYVTRGLLDEENLDGTVTPGMWRQGESNGFFPIGRVGSNNTAGAAAQIRVQYQDYFTNFPIIKENPI